MATIEDLEEHINSKPPITLTEALQKYAVVDAVNDPVNGSYIIMADRNPAMSGDIAIAELGYASPSPWTSWTRAERVPELMDKIGLRTYYDMKRADGTVRGGLRLIKTPILAARWFVEPASDSTVDKNIAEFVEKNLFEELSVPWSRVVEDALLMCDYGFMPFELVFTIDGGKLKLQKLAPRHPMDVQEWIWDSNGGINGVIMENTQGFGPNYDYMPTIPQGSFGSSGTQRGGNQEDFQGIQSNTPQVFIPVEKMVIFVLEQEAGDLRGISILRSAYKHYYYKDTLYKIDAIQKERHGIGVPIIKLPPGFSKADRDLADDLGRNLRTNERAHIVVPSNWDISFAKLEGQPVDCLTSIEHHDMKIKSNILAPFMDQANLGSGTGGFDMFFKSTRYIANTVCDTVNHFVIPKLVNFNSARGGFPKLRVRRIGEWEDIRTMSFAFRNFVGAGAIQPDDDLEKFLRSELDLPPQDKATTRVQPTPQMAVGQGAQEQLNPDITGGIPGRINAPEPGAPTPPTPARVGPPRQSTTASTGTGKSNTGRDTSGGK